jgi:membrane fusion protein (multidrug efflux system)
MEKYAVCFALALMLASAGCRRGEPLASLPTEAQRAGGAREVRTVRPRVAHGSEEISATGTTAPRSMTKVMPLVPGLIVSMPVKEGDSVKKGQQLATIDQRGYRLNVRQAEAAIASARVALDATRREKERFQKLMQEDATARAQFDQVMDRFRGAEAAMNQALVMRDMARKALGDTVLRAPYAGVVVKKLASVGDYATSMPPTVLLAMMDIASLELKIALPEPELDRVAQGARVSARFASLGKSVETTVSRVVRSIDPLTRSFEAIAEIPNPELALKPGLFADVKIASAKPRRRLLLAAAAVVDEGGGVFSAMAVAFDGRGSSAPAAGASPLRSGVARRIEIRIATVDRETSEVLSGLEGSEELILDPGLNVMDGDQVQVKPERQTSPPPRAEAAR